MADNHVTHAPCLDVGGDGNHVHMYLHCIGPVSGLVQALYQQQGTQQGIGSHLHTVRKDYPVTGIACLGHKIPSPTSAKVYKHGIVSNSGRSMADRGDSVPYGAPLVTGATYKGTRCPCMCITGDRTMYLIELTNAQGHKVALSQTEWPTAEQVSEWKVSGAVRIDVALPM